MEMRAVHLAAWTTAPCGPRRVGKVVWAPPCGQGRVGIAVFYWHLLNPCSDARTCNDFVRSPATFGPNTWI